jgi:hypothetical protein
MIELLLFELTLGFVVFCADSVDQATRRSLWQRLVRAACWPVPLARWLTKRNTTALARFGSIVWFLVTAGWLLTLEPDRIEPTALFLVLAEATMGFVIYVVDAMSADLQRHWPKRLFRSLVWPCPLAGYLRDRDSIKIMQASVTVWILLITGWLLGLVSDRVAAPLGFGG